MDWKGSEPQRSLTHAFCFRKSSSQRLRASRTLVGSPAAFRPSASLRAAA